MATDYDIHFQLLDPDVQEKTGKYFNFGFVSAIAVRGPQKLINRWLKCLLTPKGSDPREPGYGTGFMLLMGSNIADLKDATDAATLFVEDCNSQIHAMDLARFAPDEERLESAVVTQIIPHESGAGFEIYVTIRNVAGLSIPLQLPAIARR